MKNPGECADQVEILRFAQNDVYSHDVGFLRPPLGELRNPTYGTTPGI
ncbi:MAG: hypothetical protein ACE5GA_02560 [Candidatus Zixiibacteriota bacterium]